MIHKVYKDPELVGGFPWVQATVFPKVNPLTLRVAKRGMMNFKYFTYFILLTHLLENSSDRNVNSRIIPKLLSKV